MRILAIDPTTKGFGFAVLEGPDRLVDWGTKTCRGDKAASVLRKIAELCEDYAPDLLVLEDVRRPGSRRCLRMQALIAQVRAGVIHRRIRVRLVPRRRVRATFAPAKTKEEIARAVAARFPELTPLPPSRRPWMSERERMAVFDATALAVASLGTKANGEALRAGGSRR